MATEVSITVDERRKYLAVVSKRYEAAGRSERGLLLDEMAAVTGLHRKSLVRLSEGHLERPEDMADERPPAPTSVPAAPGTAG